MHRSKGGKIHNETQGIPIPWFYIEFDGFPYTWIDHFR